MVSVLSTLSLPFPLCIRRCDGLPVDRPFISKAHPFAAVLVGAFSAILVLEKGGGFGVGFECKTKCGMIKEELLWIYLFEAIGHLNPLPVHCSLAEVVVQWIDRPLWFHEMDKVHDIAPGPVLSIRNIKNHHFPIVAPLHFEPLTFARNHNPNHKAVPLRVHAISHRLEVDPVYVDAVNPRTAIIPFGRRFFLSFSFMLWLRRRRCRCRMIPFALCLCVGLEYIPNLRAPIPLALHFQTVLVVEAAAIRTERESLDLLSVGTSAVVRRHDEGIKPLPVQFQRDSAGPYFLCFAEDQKHQTQRRPLCGAPDDPLSVSSQRAAL